MKKEVLFAVFGGLLIGCIVATSIYFYSKNNRESSQFDQSVIERGSEDPNLSEDSELLIENPKQNDLQINSLTAFSGIAKSDTQILISSETEDKIVNVGSEGQFQTSIRLNEGVNQILIASFNQSNIISQKAISLVHFLALSANIQEYSSFSVQRGVVSDLTDDSIEIQTYDNKIQLISINKELVKITKAKQSLGFSDIAIGDYVIVMGPLHPNDVIDAVEIKIVDTPEDLNRKILLGKVAETGRRFIKVSLDELDTITVNTTNNIKVTNVYDEVTDMADLEIGSTIIFSGVLDRGEVYARIIKEVSKI